MADNQGISPLYFQIGKQLAVNLATAYAQTDPRVALGVTVVNTILQAQAAVVAHNAILVKAQSEEWTDTDPRWDAVLAEQQSRMDAENARHDGMK